MSGAPRESNFMMNFAPAASRTSNPGDAPSPVSTNAAG
jgi:hypothetical protein